MGSKSMERKFFIKGFNKTADFPVLHDDEAYSWREASVRAKKYLEKMGLLKKVMIYEREEGMEERVAKLIYKNMFGGLEEIYFWRVHNLKKN